MTLTIALLVIYGMFCGLQAAQLPVIGLTLRIRFDWYEATTAVAVATCLLILASSYTVECS